MYRRLGSKLHTQERERNLWRGALLVGLHLISRLRDDSVLKYIYRGPTTGKKGRPKKFDGRVDPDQLDMNYFCESVSSDELKVYSAIVYSKAFERKINLAVAIFYKNGKEIARKLYFSTDLDMTAEKLSATIAPGSKLIFCTTMPSSSAA